MTPGHSRTPLAEQLGTHRASLRKLGLEFDVADFDEKMVAWCGRMLLADRWAKLDQAGRSDAEKVRLSKVFVDAPLVGAGDGAAGFLAQRLTDTPHNLCNPLVNRAHPEVWSEAQRERDPDFQRLKQGLGSRDHAKGTVLIGGPGQGKSTMTQMLCQVHRAWWATTSSEPAQAKEARAFLDDVRELLPEPAELLLPVRIDLARLLVKLRKGGAELWSVLGDEIGLNASEASKLLPVAFRAVPLLIALDGLDEVPVSGGRDGVLATVGRFLDAIEGARGSLLVTTRPQGYTREFAGLAEATMGPWDVDTAKGYARRLLAQRYPDQHDERAQLEERIDEACDDEQTARLMTTPLQVTMMAGLVTYLGRPPRERWKLFLEYYRLIVARESRKPGLARDILAKYERFVREIHQHVAVLLQARAETEEAAPLVDRTELAAIVRARLERETFPEELRERLVAQMVEVATDRLVFLVQPSEGGFGFEVRSLQEFFAAGALTTGDDDVIVERVVEVARASSWQNVVIFAVGRAMEDFSPQMQERLTLGLCDALDAPGDDPLDGVAWPSAGLAMQLLRDGAVLSVPRIAKPLLERALRVLDLPPCEAHDDLAETCADREVDEATRAHDTLLQRITATSSWTLSGWRALLSLAELREEDRAIVTKRWPDSREERAAIFDAVVYRPAQREWLASWVLSTLEQYAPEELSYTVQRLLIENGAELGATVIALCTRPPWTSASSEAHEPQILPIKFCALPTATDYCLPAELVDRLAMREAWRPVLAMEAFYRAPSKASLASVLDAEATAWERGPLSESRAGGAWVVDACLRLADSPAALRDLARRAREGELGDLDDWRAAEQRWITHGLRAADILAWVEGAPFGRDIASRGTPGLWSYGESWRNGAAHQPALEVTEALIAEMLRLPESPMRSTVAAQTRSAALRWRIKARDLSTPLTLEQAEPLLFIAPGTITLRGLDLVAVDDVDEGAWLDRMFSDNATARDGDVSVPWRERIANWVLDRWKNPATRASVEALATEPNLFFSSAGLRREVEKTPPLAFATPSIASSQWVSWFRDERAPAETLVEWWQTIATRGAFAFLWFYASGSHAQREVLRRIWSIAPDTLAVRRHLLSIIRAAQSDRRSALARNGTWGRLQLPQPGPVASASTPILDRSAPRPTRITLSGLRGHAETSIDVEPGADDEGSLLLLLGENGTGKTTLLRAIAFALAADVAGSFVQQSRAPYLRDPTQPAECRVETARGPFHVRVERVATTEQLVELNAPCRPFVAAYGCRRGSALGSPERATNIGAADFVDNLFDRPSGLTRAETWLHALKPGPNASDESVQRFRDVIEQLRVVVPDVSSLEIDDDGSVRATLKADPEHPVMLEALSDGYLTTLGWVIDLMALWVHWRTKMEKQPVPPNFASVMSGYVLIDEIDLHLHPVWQTHVLADLRRVFPKLHFIATTHNPLTLVGARPGEVRRLVRDPESHKISVEEPPYDPRLKTGGELYEQFFGIDRLYPTELGEALREYSYLAGDPDRSDEEEARLREIIARFEREGVSPGWDPVARSGSETSA